MNFNFRSKFMEVMILVEWDQLKMISNDRKGLRLQLIAQRIKVLVYQPPSDGQRIRRRGLRSR